MHRLFSLCLLLIALCICSSYSAACQAKSAPCTKLYDDLKSASEVSRQCSENCSVKAQATCSDMGLQATCSANSAQQDPIGLSNSYTETVSRNAALTDDDSASTLRYAQPNTNDTVSIISSRSQGLSVWDPITNLPNDWLRFGRAAFRWKCAPLFGGIVVSTIASVVYDRELLVPVRDQYKRSSTTSFAMDRGVDIGDGKFQFGIAAGFALYGWAYNDKHALSTALQVSEVILAAGGVVQLLKHLTGRESPFTATKPTGRWVLFPNQIEYIKHVPHYDAFPSGHVCTALATLTVVAENYPEATWLKYVGYPAIAWLGYSMVGQGIHWVSDYPLSIALGYTFGQLIAHRDLFSKSSSQAALNSRVRSDVYPYFQADGAYGLNVQVSW